MHLVHEGGLLEGNGSYMQQQGLETVGPFHTAGNEYGLAAVEKSLATVTSPQDRRLRNPPLSLLT